MLPSIPVFLCSLLKCCSLIKFFFPSGKSWCLDPQSCGIWKAGLLQHSWALGYATAVTRSVLGSRDPLSPSQVFLVSSGWTCARVEFCFLLWPMRVPQPSLHTELVTQSQIPTEKELDQTFLWLKGKYREGREFDFFLMTAHSFLDVSLLLSLQIGIHPLLSRKASNHLFLLGTLAPLNPCLFPGEFSGVIK